MCDLLRGGWHILGGVIGPRNHRATIRFCIGEGKESYNGVNI
jgi:hypothetical protein